MDAFHLLNAVLRAVVIDRQRLVLENLDLRQRVAVPRRGVKRPKLEEGDRSSWLGLMRLLDTWRQALPIDQPETVVAWQRKSWRLCLPETPVGVSQLGRMAAGRRPSHVFDPGTAPDHCTPPRWFPRAH
jgi:hypothetical protein